MELQQLKQNQDFIVTAYEMADSSGALEITKSEREKNHDTIKLLQQKFDSYCKSNLSLIIKTMRNRGNIINE